MPVVWWMWMGLVPDHQRIVHANPRSVHWLNRIEIVSWAKSMLKRTDRTLMKDNIHKAFATVSPAFAAASAARGQAARFCAAPNLNPVK
jgi:hypothetical protein